MCNQRCRILLVFYLINNPRDNLKYLFPQAFNGFHNRDNNCIYRRVIIKL